MNRTVIVVVRFGPIPKTPEDAANAFDPKSIYHWMVRRGSLRIFASLESAAVDVFIDPEGSEFVVCDRQDAFDVAGILAAVARPIWDAHPANLGVKGDFVAENGVYRWSLAEGPLRIAAEGDEVHIGDARPQRFLLRIHPLIEVAQVLEQLALSPSS